jgi:proline iminopeptidase
VVQRYSVVEPHESGWLEVGEGQRIYWEVSGNPAGKPALTLHGGPGSGLSPHRRGLFDPERYRLVQFDQRGCGRSLPSVSDRAVSLEHNTTPHLIADIERLREHLGVDRWLVWGGSWGVTLALAYAQRFPERVSEMLLASVTMTRRSDVHWLYHEAGRFFPEQWHRFAAGVPAHDRHGDLVAGYDRLLNRQLDLSLAEVAAQRWCEWEDAVVSLEPGWEPDPRYADADFRIAFARLCTHYFSHAAWLADDELLHGATRLAGIPAALVHGRFDIGGPPDVPWLLARAWPAAELHLVDTGHQGGAAMTAVMIAALDRFAQARTP